MTKKLFHSLCFMAFAVFLASVILIMGVLYGYFSRIQQTQLRMQTQLAAQGVAQSGLRYFDGLETRDYRLTWIAADGIVLYDSDADSVAMENHLEREEIREALLDGFGESQRYSATLTERMLYAAQMLEDGTVLRLSITQSSVLGMLLGVGPGLAVVLVFALLLSVFLSRWLSRRMVEPLNRMDLDHPLDNEGYEEIAPLLRRLDGQQCQLKEQQTQLQRQKDELDAIIGGMSEGMILFNPAGIILAINPAASSLLDAQEPCVGKDILSISRNLDIQSVLNEALSGSHAEKTITLRGEQYLLSANPVWSEGRVLGAALLLMDISEKVQAEQLRREFTANVSHELKTPLQTISGYAELMQVGMVKPEDIQPFSGKIYAEAQRMMQLISDIISLSRLDEGAGDMRLEDVDLFDIAKTAVHDLQEQADKAGICLALIGKSCPMSGIPGLLYSIVFNLCDNGIQYNHAGGNVNVATHMHDNTAILTVSDNGIGIPKAQQEHIFERFYRVDKSRSRAIGGTGLGLSIVKHAAIIHSAKIDVVSEPGKGTTVRVRFPLRTAMSEPCAR